MDLRNKVIDYIWIPFVVIILWIMGKNDFIEVVDWVFQNSFWSFMILLGIILLYEIVTKKIRDWLQC
jgi:hypothetical protein